MMVVFISEQYYFDRDPIAGSIKRNLKREGGLGRYSITIEKTVLFFDN